MHRLAARPLHALTLATLLTTAIATFGYSPDASALPGPSSSITATSPAQFPTGLSTPTNPADLTGGRYIVTLAENPAVTYQGTTAGLARTSPTGADDFEANAPATEIYTGHLRSTQNKVAADHGVQPTQHFTVALNGFAAALTADQAAALVRDTRVARLDRDEASAPSESTLDYLNLTGKDGVWSRWFGGSAQAGDGMVIGVVDSGYYPRSAFFAGEPLRTATPGSAPRVGEPYLRGPGQTAMLKADGGHFRGICQAGGDFTASTCNTKVIGARYFAATFLEQTPADKIDPLEMMSPEDVRSHGSHVASLAAGGLVDSPTYGRVSGTAPGAKLAIYKSCWDDIDPSTGGCFESDNLAAVEAAIQDNVDVINFSLSNRPVKPFGPLSMAFLSATKAGIFVAAAAGNLSTGGPGTFGTVMSPDPWVTTVANTTWSGDGAPVIHTTSRQGPTAVGGGDLLKPDLAAPGAGVVGAFSPVRDKITIGRKTGTSMASPHVAGLAALLMQAHPTWSPSRVKSALMTTSQPVRTTTGAVSLNAFAQGAGLVQPRAAFEPALSIEMTPQDYDNFLAGQGVYRAGASAVEARNANLPSISLGTLSGTESATRTFTALTPGAYRVSAYLPGVRVTVSDANPTFDRSGDRRSVTFAFTNESVPQGTYTFGYVQLSGKDKAIRLPVVVRPG